MYDILIAGAGPAGATAAILLARRKRRVALIDQQPIPVPRPGWMWLGARTRQLWSGIDVSLDGVFDDPIHTVVLRSADLSRSIVAPLEAPAAYVVDAAAINRGLTDAAIEAGVEVLPNASIRRVAQRESDVTLTLESSETVQGRLLIGAWGANSRWTHRVGVVPPSNGPIQWAAEIEVDAASLGDASMTPAEGPAGPTTAELILGLDGGGVGYILRSRNRLKIGLHARSASDEMKGRLRQLCAALGREGAVSRDLVRHAAGAIVRQSPSSAALDYESHVGKHAVLIGEAGGFVGGMSNEGVYPASWSASIAADVLDEALAARSSQDHLMQFDARWRTEMADYLRPPQTELQFLLPLIFTREPMAVRMANAYFLGENV